MKLGIVGQGYVGTAVKEVMSKYYEIKTFDKQSVKLNISVFCRNTYNEYTHVRENG